MKQIFLYCFFCFSVYSLMAQEFTPYGKRRFVEGRRAVVKGDKYGFVDQAYEHVIPRIYLQAMDFAEGLAAVKLDTARTGSGQTKSSWIFIDKQGNKAIEGTFDSVIHSFKEGYAAVNQDNKTQIINKRGQVVVAVDSKWRLPFRKGLVEVTSDNIMYGVANLQGQLVVPMVYDYVEILSPQVVLVHKEGKIGLVSNEGQVLAAPQYDESSLFNEGLLAVKKGGKWGFINDRGEEIIPMQYDIPSIFANGISSVSLNEEEFYIDKTGRRISVTDSITTVKKKLVKPNPEKEFLELLNQLVKDNPYFDDYYFESFVDSPFVIRNKILVGTFRTYSPDGPVLQKITVPVAKLHSVWYDYYMGLELSDQAALIQTTQPGKKVFNKGETTNILRLAVVGDGVLPENELQKKLQAALTALKATNKK